MRSELRKGQEVPAWDEAVLRAIATATVDKPDGYPMKIGVRNETGAIYRVIETMGLPEFFRLVTAMAQDACLIDELEDADTSRASFDALFRRQPDGAAGIGSPPPGPAA